MNVSRSAANASGTASSLGNSRTSAGMAMELVERRAKRARPRHPPGAAPAWGSATRLLLGDLGAAATANEVQRRGEEHCDEKQDHVEHENPFGLKDTFSRI